MSTITSLVKWKTPFTLRFRRYVSALKTITTPQPRRRRTIVPSLEGVIHVVQEVDEGMKLEAVVDEEAVTSCSPILTP